MALAKQVVALPIDRGLNTKTDPKQEEPGFLRTAENVVYETLKMLRKRNGYDAVSLQTVTGSRITDAEVLTRYGNELNLLTASRLYSFSSSVEQWTEKGAVYPVQQSSETLLKNANAQSFPTGTVVQNLFVSAWADSSGGVRYSVQDLQNNSFLISDALLAGASATRPIVTSISNSTYVFYVSGANLFYKKFNVLQPSSLGSAVLVANDVDTSAPIFDVHGAQNTIIIAYNSTVMGNKLALCTLSSTDVLSSTLNLTGTDASFALDVTTDPNSRVLIAWSSGTSVKYAIYSLALTSPIRAPTTAETIADCVNLTITATSTDAQYRIYYEIEQAADSDHYIKSVNVPLSGSVGSPSVFVRSLGLSGTAFRKNGTIFVPCVHGSQLQPTFFLLDESASVVSKYFNQEAGGLLSSGVLPHTQALSTDEFLLLTSIKSRISGQDLVFYSTLGVGYNIVDFSPSQNFQTLNTAGNLLIAAGLLKSYDGSTLAEHGFNIWPETLTQGVTATTGGFMSNGSYGYVAIYKWTDNTGRDHRSAPTALPLTVTLSGGTATQKVEIIVPTLRVTEKDNVSIEIYRTEDAGTTYYKVTDDLAPVLNDKTVDIITFEDTLSDTTLISRELLYTTGGVLENIAPASANLLTSYSGRVAYVGELRNRVLFSKIIEEGEAAAFSDILFQDFSSVGGPITAIASMNDKLVVFAQDACFYVAGDVANNLGEQPTLTSPEIISTDIGCVDTNSVVLTPAGLMFKSRKGIYLLGNGLNLQYVGDRVEAFNSSTITSAQIVGELNQIRFTTDSELALVYNYNLDKWATFTNHGAKSAVVIRNDYFYLREDGELYQENRTSFSDASSPIKMRIETGWLSLAELQGFQRVYRALLLGDYKSSHRLTVKVAYDFIEAWTQQESIDVLEFVSDTRYGGDSPYGSGSPYGGNGNLYQIRLDLERQKCQSVKLLIEDAQDVVGEGLSLSGITFQVGAKQGTNKLGASNQYGTSGE